MQETSLKRSGATASEPTSTASILGAEVKLPDSAKKLYIKTFGCQMNEYDSDKMADLLNAKKGLELTQNPEEADVILLNTCSIREKAQEKEGRQGGVLGEGREGFHGPRGYSKR